MPADLTGIESAAMLIPLALDEDLQQRGDLTSQATISESATATVEVVAREAGVLSGSVLIPLVYQALAERMPSQPTRISVRNESTNPPSYSNETCIPNSVWSQ